MNLRTFVLAGAAAALILSPGVALAQQTQGPMSVERNQDGLMIAPDVEVGRVGSTTATMAGAYGGWMFDNTLLVGAGGYWQTDRSLSRRMDYGGAVVEWLAYANRPVGFGARALIGGGDATLPANITFSVPVPVLQANGRLDHFDFKTQTIATRVRTDFVVAEPQADLLLNISSLLRVRIGAGYRFVGAARGFDNQLQGATASVGLQIGGSTSTRVTR